MTNPLDPDRFRFDRSPYERPNFKYRCGRAAAWGTPCVRGPNPDGSCGGVATCNPVKNQNGRFECRRPTIAGGPCSDGPLPDGTCALCQPPCTPRRSLRGLRGRLGLLALGLVVALVLGLSGISKGRIAGLSSLDPGPLTTGHAGFIAAGDCTVCHAKHNSGPTEWIAAVFSDSDVAGKCTECHVFGGPARQAHNRINPDRPDIGEVTCQMCHTEHKGEFANIVEISDVQCATCHETKFSSFSSSHPAFGKSFPYFKRTAIKFNHGSHFAKHFGDARFADRAPETCLACHSQSPNQRSLVRSGFEKTCAACHGGLMAQRELVLLRLPEFVENTIDKDSVVDACGPIFDEFGAMFLPAAVEQAWLEMEHGVTPTPSAPASSCAACHGGGGATGDGATTFTSLLAAGNTDWTSAPPATGAGVVLAALSDDALIAELAVGLTSAVDLLAAHENQFDPAMDVVVRDEQGISREVFRDRDYMIIEIPMRNYDRFIVIDYFMSDGQVLHMYPDATVNDNVLAAGVTLTLGVPGTGGQAWQIGPPYGDDLLMVIASDKRLYTDERSMVERTAGYVAFLEQQLSDGNATGTVELQYRVVSTAADEAAAAAIIAERRRNQAGVAEEAAAALAEQERLAKEAEAAKAAEAAAALAEQERLAKEAEAAKTADAAAALAEQERLAKEAEAAKATDAAAALAEQERLAEEAEAAEEEDEADEDEEDVADDDEEADEEDVAKDEDEDEEEFESVSIEESSVIGAFLLDVVADDPDEYTEPMQELILAMAEGGLAPLAALIDDRADQDISSQLLAGLNPESVKRVACAWAANLEYELPADATMGGWYGDYLELRYRPQGHGDNVATSWIEFAIAAGAAAEDDDAGERAIELRDSMIDPKEGVGGCMKCHAVSAVDEDENENHLVVEWRAREVANSPQNLNFSHGIHLRLLDAKAADLGESQKGCRWCHKLDPEADFASGYDDFDPHSYTSSFSAIAKETCADCHSEGNVREDCQLCHDYHREPSFNIRISSHAD